MLSKHELPVAREETERCDTLRYSWQLLQGQAVKMSSILIDLQPRYRRQLVENVQTFIADCEQFYESYNSVSVTFRLSASRIFDERTVAEIFYTVVVIAQSKVSKQKVVIKVRSFISIFSPKFRALHRVVHAFEPNT
jgi:hypothetical protein